MIQLVRRSISNKLMLVIMATSLFALITYAGAMLAYDLRGYHNTLVKDLQTQATIIAEISIPALDFNDPQTARENLQLLRTRPMILGASLFTAKGQRFADYTTGINYRAPWPERLSFTDNYLVRGDHILVWKRVVRDGELLGLVYLHARYEANQRLSNYLIILAGVMGISLGLAMLIAIWLRGAVTKPLLSVTSVARAVMQSRDFSLRASKYTDDEIGVLADAFNDMLDEVGRRASALEASNQSLGREMKERHAAEAALREADRRKDEFLATLAHELRNPLAPLTNGLHILKLAKNNPEAAERARWVMERQLKQMVRLVDDLLDISRLTTGKLAINKSHVLLQSIITEAIELTASFIGAYGHDLKVTMPDEPVYVEADALRLGQILTNLLNNAAKYTDPGGAITLELVAEDGAWLIKVSDNGIGIPREMLTEIFGMFIQADTSPERARAGLGVGLALSRHLAELHGFRLEASSEGLNQGSCFSLKMPVLAQPLPDVPIPENERQPQAGRRILLVDDNVDFVSTMADLLTSLGHEVRVAYGAGQALEIAAGFSPQFAFLDIGLPGMSGYELAGRLRQVPQAAGAVLVAITGWGQEKDRQQSQQAGFDHHLVKPVELDQILGLLEASGQSASPMAPAPGIA
jgi:signal transduction histidine kinase/ActR/RegA family two-component response regulator